VARIAGWARVIHAELRCRGLAKNNRAGPPQHRDGVGVLRRLAAGKRRTAIFRRHIGGVEHILYADWKTMQWAEKLAGGAPCVGEPSAFARTLRIKEGPGFHTGLACGDSIETCLDQISGVDLAAAEAGNQAARG